ncbi:hypothetical protein KBC70_02535 [Candidatus Woesebacteria bacterium]|jgi:hypothetical protein|nr:hypothetical protein [Candidatus Woesebacteria bacterium]
MDKKKQHIVSIVIGIILTVLLLIIGVRIVQRRSSQASEPTSFSAQRTDADSCKITAITQSDEGILVRYGAASPTFFYRFSPENVAPQGDGSYIQEATIDQLSESRVTFVVEGHENITAACDPFSGAASATDTQSGNDSILPTAEPTVEPSAAPTVEPTVDVPEEQEALTVEAAAAFYEDNPNEPMAGCVKEFENEYLGLASACGKAYYQRDTTSN